MAKLYQNRAGQYFTKSKIHGRVVTLQIADEGADFLHDIGIEIGDELGAVYWDLVDNHWIYTLGEFPGGGELDISDEWVRHDALSTISPEIRDVPKEPLTHLGNDELTTVPRFLYAPHKSIYYTILHVENSSDSWLEVPILIKHHGAQELLRRGAVLGQEFTEAGLRLLFLRRWGYFDEDRYHS
jgi:hypothetical protein